MARIRWTLLLLAVGIALPAFLIVDRAITGLGLESSIRHEAVADRVFDEMERSLSDLLEREEARPPSEYAFVQSPPGGARLPAAFDLVDEPFVVGWFALDARGESRILSPDPTQAGRVEVALRQALSLPTTNERIEGLADAVGATPAPGRTKALGTKDDDAAGSEASGENRTEESAYGVLQSLNRAQLLRSERQSKRLRDGVPSEAPPSSPRAERMPEAALGADFAADLEPEPELAEARMDRLDGETEAETVEDEERDADRWALSVDPLIGRTTSLGDLVLARSVWKRESGGRGESVERQGLVLDRAGLIAWLESRVLDETGLSERARLDFGADAPAIPNDGTHHYLHRFAEPFDALIARLDLDPIPGLASGRPVYALAFLLLVVTVVGLFAVDRMTRVVVDYAKRRSDFVAAVSHELKTPLTSIRMYAEMLRDGLVSSESKRDEYYATITDESERLSRLIDNVLEFSRLEQGRRDPRLVVGGLSEAIREAAEKLRAHVEREGFELRLELDEAVPVVEYDRDAVTQILFNLVDNSLKYARHAAIRRIEIGLRRQADGKVELAVRDFGPGVPADELRRVFEPFYRLGEELTRTTEGTGIGLALVKELAADMGADAKGRNTPGGGFEVGIAFAPAS